VLVRFRAGMTLQIVVGCYIEWFKRYYGKLAEDKEWQGSFWIYRGLVGEFLLRILLFCL
jgi:hypothetical protein